MNRTRLRWIAVLALAAALSAIAFSAAADDELPTDEGVTQDAGDPMPVEPDGGVGDTPMPVEPDGGIGDGAGPIPAGQG